MLTIIVPAVPDREIYDEAKNEFLIVKGMKKSQTLQLEHSLVSVSKWESKWHKPFISKEEKSFEETIDYVKCMTLTSNVDPVAYSYLTEANIKDINAYIENPMTATTFNDRSSNKSREVVTAELIYYWMIALNVPFECQKWHLNKLLTLIRVCNIKNEPQKKMSQAELMSRNSALNAARRKQFRSKG